MLTRRKIKFLIFFAIFTTLSLAMLKTVRADNGIYETKFSKQQLELWNYVHLDDPIDGCVQREFKDNFDATDNESFMECEGLDYDSCDIDDENEDV